MARLDALLLSVFGLLVLGDLAWLFVAAPTPWSVVGAFVGWYFADVLSGVVHFLLDYLPCPEHPGLAELFAYEGSRGEAEYEARRREVMKGLGPYGTILFDFKCHHPRPNVLGRRTLAVLVRPALIFGGIPGALAMNVLFATLPVPAPIIAALDTLLLGGVLSQYIHGTLHRRHNPWFVGLLRRLRLWIGADAHGVHHATLDRDFATVNGWSNPMVNRMFALCRTRGWLRDEGLEPR